MKQKEFVCLGAISNLEKILAEYSVKSVFLVRGRQSFISSGAKYALMPVLSEFKVTEFSNFNVNPKIEEALLGYQSFKDNGSELIIAIGGGSVIDTAKIIKYLAVNEQGSDYIEKPIPIIAIPTTAGTGSEATRFAVVYINGKKTSYEADFLLPDVSIVDANLLNGQSKYQIAVSGIDAFAQGIESYWSIHSTSESMRYSEKAIKLIWGNLENAINNVEVAKIRVAEGSNNAGKAINITKTTAPHALSYGFTSMFGLPHGHAVALFLPFFIQYHKTMNDIQCVDARGIKHLFSKLNKIASIIG